MVIQHDERGHLARRSIKRGIGVKESGHIAIMGVIFLLVVVFVASEAGEIQDAILEPIELIKRWDYPAELHTTTTSDGYILQMHRIPTGRQPGESTEGRPAVLVVHGLVMTSGGFIGNLPNQSLAFVLADAGYDVWLANIRGNTYGMEHVRLDPHKDHALFWDFDWEQHGKEDLDAFLSKIEEITGQTRVHYIGHSQGTLMLFTRLADDAQLAPRIKTFSALAPVFSVRNIKGPVPLVTGAAVAVAAKAALLGWDELLPPSTWLGNIFGLPCSFIGYECGAVDYIAGGPPTKQYNDVRHSDVFGHKVRLLYLRAKIQSRVSVYMHNFPSSTSEKNIVHWAQMVAGETRRFDYFYLNKQHYGTDLPPGFNLTAINVPMYLYWSPDDWLADEKDIFTYIVPKLNPQYLKAVNKVNGYNHFDFLFAINAVTDVYQPVIQVLDEYEKNAN